MLRHRIAVFLAGLTVLAACGKKKVDAGALQSYEVRGVLKVVAEDSSEVTIHHEAIPTFIDREGKKSPMMSMSMPFGIAEGVDFSALSAGDKISFTFDVDWERPVTPTRIQSVQRLSDDTELAISGH